MKTYREELHGIFEGPALYKGQATWYKSEEVDAEIERLRAALEQCEHETHSLRVRSGTEWIYSPYQAGRIARIVRDALEGE